LRGTIHYPTIQDGEVDCPKRGCGGSIKVNGRNLCGRCGTKVYFYKKRKKIVKMTFQTNGNYILSSDAAFL
jgi:hypothetical protein